MKKTILYCLFALFSLSQLSAQGAGIQFEKGAWEEILAKAKAEDKVIFMDAYTTWCGPCKMMSKNVFTQKNVGDYFNKNFINVKMDMERGEGPALASKFRVMAYPTLLFINSKGDEVHRAVGFHAEAPLLELGETANSPGKTLAGMTQRYEFGDRSEQFLYDYTFALADAMTGTHEKVAEEYLDKQKDWSSEKNLTFLFRFLDSTKGKMFDYFIDNKDQFTGIFGETPVARKLQYLIQSSVQETEDESAIDQIAAVYKKVYPDKAPELTSEFKVMYYLRAGDLSKYISATKQHFADFGTNNWENLNEAAWNFYEFADNSKDLKTAVKWAKKSIALEENFYNTDTMAALYYKLGKKGKARKTAEKAITLAKSAGDDYSSTQELLDAINNM